MSSLIALLTSAGADAIARQRKRVVWAILFWGITLTLGLVAVFACFAAFAAALEAQLGPVNALLATAGLAVALVLAAFLLRWISQRMRRRRPDRARETLLALAPALAASDKRVLLAAAVIAGYAFGTTMNSARDR